MAYRRDTVATVSKAQATLRPWTHPARSVSVFGKYEGKDDLTKICDTSMHAKDVATAVANAALIVQAVNAHDDLYAALEAALTWWHSKPSNIEKKEPEFLAQARGALAKAKGEAPAN